MIFVIIPTTKERRPRLEKCIEAIHKNTKYPITICTYEQEEGCNDIGWVKALHKMLEGIDGLCFCLGDDVIIAPDCIEKLYETYEKLHNKEEWVVQPYDLISKGELASLPFCHSSILKKYIYKGYQHNYSDTEFTAIMKMKGRYFTVEDAIADHQHFTVGAKYDETYRKTHELGTIDKQLFEKRQTNNFEPKNQ